MSEDSQPSRRPGGTRSAGIAGLRKRHVGQLLVQLADLLEAGCPVSRSLEAINRQASHLALATLARRLNEEIENGASLAGAMEQISECFSEVHVAMVRASEAGGFLQKTLVSLASHSTQLADTAKQIRAKLAYPAVLAVTVIASVAFLLTYVVPKFERVFRSRENLPRMTQVLLDVGDFVGSFGVEMLAGIVGVCMLGAFLFRAESIRLRWDTAKLKLPGIGRLMRDWQIYSFASTMALLLAGGVTALRSLRLSAKVVGNLNVQRQIVELAAAVERGEPLSGPMRQSELFDATTVEMVVVSEATGKLGHVLERLAAQRYRDFQMRIGVMLSLLEPVIILVMGVLVGLTVMALLLPVISMNSLIG